MTTINLPVDPIERAVQELNRAIDEHKVVEFPIEHTMVRAYKFRRASSNTKTIEICIPRKILIGVAERKGITFEEFLETYQAVAYYGFSDEILYRFEKVKNGKGTKGT